MLASARYRRLRTLDGYLFEPIDDLACDRRRHLRGLVPGVSLCDWIKTAAGYMRYLLDVSHVFREVLISSLRI
jgi:hypothetical protein